MRFLQEELEELCKGMAALAEKLPATNSDADWPDEIKKLVVQLNGFLETCAEYPQVFLARSPGMPPAWCRSSRLPPPRARYDTMRSAPLAP